MNVAYNMDCMEYMRTLPALALHHAAPHEPKYISPKVQRVERDLSPGLVGSVIALVPHDCSATRENKIIRSPNDLIFADPEKLRKVPLIRRETVKSGLFVPAILDVNP